MVTYDCNCKDVRITEGIFGEIYAESAEDKIHRYDSKDYYGDAETKGLQLIPVKSYTMINKNNLEITVISWGATIVSLKYPDKFGCVADVVLGFDDLKSYTNPKINPFIGCILGRCANRIRDGSITIKGKIYELTKNDLGKHHLHGGTKGFGRQLWESHIDGCSVVMTYLSKDGDEGYPGAVLSTVKFKLMPDDMLEIGIRATTTKSTIVNISHGSLFNLAGHDAGKTELMKHKISLNCDRWTFADYTDPIPTGSIRGVGGTIMDLRVPKFLESCIEKVPPGEGYDHNFCVTPNWHGGNTYVAQAVHPKSGRILEIYSNQPGVQFYTGGRLCSTSEIGSNPASVYDSPNHEEVYKEEETIDEMKQDVAPKSESQEFISGKKGARYAKHCAFSIQPQNYPNAINYSHFPCSILQPGEVYYHDLIYKFGIQLANYM
ncbi:PREDICTED: aldose 1-epimerase-like [Trachymyrmex septentrionalis]|uniref:aldose 1-epimerase-like n=1 Tax=Trachymyrmex septentrionalis TaxID=34720 RepID=UPI00084EF81E|nr:PREDICTED: aldose 1-epimerase-like [Trachymyrmex septentrionalis]